MEKVNNKNGIDFYYEIDKEQNRFVIYDSSKIYFNDLELEEDDYKNNFKELIEMLEQTDIKEMCYFFGSNLYDDYEKLIRENDLTNYKEDNILNCDYVNRFVVNDKVYYTYQ